MKSHMLPKIKVLIVDKVKIKLKLAVGARVSVPKPVVQAAKPAQAVRSLAETSYRVIAIGASTGGTEAIATILAELPTKMPGIVITQHIPADFSKMFAERLNRATAFSVKEAQTGDFIVPGQVLIAPGNRHMRIKQIGSHYQVECAEGERVSGHCPSVDVLFQSVADVVGKHAIGVLLTGMGSDGAKGLLAMRANGARTIGQDEQTCIVYGMPKVANNIGAVEQEAPLHTIARKLVSLV